jgi:hemerythrin-like domain-containing protein
MAEIAAADAADSGALSATLPESTNWRKMTDTHARFDTRTDTREMYMVHTVFRREFGSLPNLIQKVPTGDIQRTQILSDHINVLGAFLYAHHHSEDIHLWPKLLDRGAREAEPIVHLMEGQHEDIERLNTEADEAAVAWLANPASESRDALANVFGQLIHSLDEHMRLEEQWILPLAEKYITAAEWHALARESGRAIPREKVPLVFGMTLYEASPELIQKTLSELPPEVRAVLQEEGPRAFSSHSERVYGTATPARSGAVMRSLTGYLPAFR